MIEAKECYRFYQHNTSHDSNKQQAPLTGPAGRSSTAHSIIQTELCEAPGAGEMSFLSFLFKCVKKNNDVD